jgi:hypothetical protein
VHAPSEEKSVDSKKQFNKELEEGFNHFPKYHMKILLVDFNAKLGREDIFKPTIGNGKRNENQFGAGGFVHRRIVSAVKREGFFSDRMSYMALRGRWCSIIVLNVHAHSEEKSDDPNNTFL